MNERSVEQPDFQTFRSVFQYVVVIILLPIASFFGAKSIIFDGILGFAHVQSSVYSAILTVIILHIVLGFYIHKAFSVDSSPKPVKQD